MDPRRGRAASGVGHDELVGIDLNHSALVFKVVVDAALAVGDGKLRLASQGDGARHCSRSRVNGRRIAAVAVEGEYTLRGGIINNGVRTVAGRDRSHRLERVQGE